MSIALYVETDGQSENPEQAIAEAALTPDTIPFEEGDVVEVKIEATWTTPDGKHHAKLPAELQENPDIEVAHDGLTDNDPENLDSSALELTPDMAEAEEEFEHDFDESRDPNSKRSQDLKDEPAPKEGYNSEGLRRKKQPKPDKKKQPVKMPS